MSLPVFVNVTQARVIYEEGTSVEKQPPPDWESLWCIILIDVWCGRSLRIVGSANPGYVVLGCVF